MILYNYWIYRVLKQLGQDHQRKGAIHFFCTCGSRKGNGQNGNCLLPNLKNLSSYPGQSAE